MIKTVLVALDGSRNAERILPVLEPLLARHKPEVLLVHVLAGGPPGGAAVRAYLRLLARTLKRKGIHVETMSPKGDPALELLRLASSRRVDLLALTTHGRGAVGRWFLGSVAHHVLRGSSCPILLAKGIGKPAGPLRTIIVPLDGSARAEAALPHALQMARAHGAGLLLLHVSPAKGIEASDSKFRRWVEATKRRMEARFEELRASAKEFRIETAFEEGDAAAAIVRRAERRPGSLLVMSSHGRTGIRRWVFGSVTEKVLQGTAAPLLIVRSFPK